jgi:hypothetical protein
VHLSTVKNEVLAEEVGFDGLEDALHEERAELEGTAITISLKKAPGSAAASA